MAKKRHIRKKGVVKNAVLSKKVPISNNINSEAIAAALSTTNQPVFLKVCRLCETKDGPFLNIFDIDKMIAKKIEDVMPFAVAENDDLPHKICFRCSAKVEELHEFIQKCVKTQITLRRAIGNKAPLPTKIKHRTLWEEKLNESNISNDDICDALIKKAMESIKEPLKVLPPEDKTTSSNKVYEKDIVQENLKESKVSHTTKSDTTNLKVEKPQGDESEVPLKKIKLQMQKPDRSKSTSKLKCTLNEDNPKTIQKTAAKPNVMDIVTLEEKDTNSADIPKPNASNASSNDKEPSKPFNILDHVSTIKVNGVGVLFQCKLCNRNFLKKEVVVAHGCAKNGGAKKIEPNKDPPKPLEPPKMPTVKYINTKVNSEVKKPNIVEEPITLDDDDDEDDKPLKPQKVKPKIGPASKVKKNNVNLDQTKQGKSDSDGQVAQFPDIQNSNPSSQAPIVQFPTTPSANSRYKLVPGPNNTFTLIEEGADNSTNVSQKPVSPPSHHTPNTTEAIKNTKPTIKITKTKAAKKADAVAPAIPQEDAVGKPYPVGLFQTVSHNPNPNIPPDAPTFTTPAMKKQSYTVVQTGNPSKLLISTKHQPPEQTVGKKKPRKTKHEPRIEEPSKEPYSVTLEDAAPPRDPGFFTFINVDPLLQPSYVLPTDSIIQESQITTSTNAVPKTAAPDKDLKYTCNMCNEKFSREKKLLTHIQSHYSKMDEEDQLRAGNNVFPTRKRGRPSVKK